jgi:dinuclear metal center YbgI/SA1388 family protein
MAKIHELTTYLEEIAPLNLQEGYDNAGLIYGDPDTEITGVLISLDLTEDVLDEAIETGCNIVVSHHPIIFRGIKKFVGHYVDRVIVKAIRHDIAVYAIHTNLDNVIENGVNGKIAEKLGLIQVSALDPKLNLDPSGSIGSGVIGNLEEGMAELDFLDFLKQAMELKVIKHTHLLGKKVHKIAVCGGSGSFLLDPAISKKADVFITSDFKYHEFFDADGKIVIIDIGHYESEQFTINLLYDLISKKFRKFAARCTKVNTNPINYY